MSKLYLTQIEALEKVGIESTAATNNFCTKQWLIDTNFFELDKLTPYRQFEFVIDDDIIPALSHFITADDFWFIEANNKDFLSKDLWDI